MIKTPLDLLQNIINRGFAFIGGIDWIDFTVYMAIWLRFCVFWFLSPFNGDSSGHIAYIEYIKEHWSLPPAGAGHETWQPPLYYILIAVFSFISPNVKFIQGFSLVTSVATVLVVRKLIRFNTFIKSDAGKQLALLIVCFLPQFVMYSLQVSNDSLAFFFAFLAFLKMDQFQAKITTKGFLGLTLLLSLGLLTKGYFLTISAMLFPFACSCYWLQRMVAPGRILSIYMIAVVFLLCGCEKYFQNAVQYGRPFINNIDFNPPWLKQLQPGYQGFHSVYDANILKLVKEPEVVCAVDEPTRHSIPLVIYGSFWYQYFIDSNFRGGDLAWPKNLGRYLDLIGVVPACFLLIGGAVFLGKLFKSMQNRSTVYTKASLLRMIAVGIFIGNLWQLLFLYFKYNTWIVLMARLLFPTLLGAFVLCDVAVLWLETRFNISKLFKLWGIAFLIGATGYFMVEMALIIN